MAQSWLGGPRADLDEDEVRETIEGGRGGLWRCGVDILDLDDKSTGEQLPITAGSVNWSYRPPDRVTGQTTDATEVRRRCDLTIVDDPPVNLLSHRFRPWVEALSLEGNWVRWWLGVFITSLPPVSDDGTVLSRTLKLADKTFRLRRELTDDVTVDDTDGPVVDWIKTSLGAQFDETRFAITSSDQALVDAMTFEAGTTWLSVYNRLLEAIGYDQLTYTESGRAHSRPLSDLAEQGPSHVYEPGTKIKVDGQVEPLLPALPNVVKFISSSAPSLPEEGNGWRTVKNQSTGPASIDESEERPTRVTVDAVDQDALDAIAYADAPRYFAGGGLRFQGRVGLNPRFGDRDVARFVRPRLGLSGDWDVTDWSLPLPVKPDFEVLMPVTAEKRITVEAA